MRLARKFMLPAAFMMFSTAALFAAPETVVQMPTPLTTSITGTIRITIPFAFSVADKKFAAGEYYVGPASDRTIVFRSVNGKQSVVALTNAVSDNRHGMSSRLVFRRYGNEYFLAQAWLRASDEGREFFVSNAETKLAKGESLNQVTVIAAR